MFGSKSASAYVALSYVGRLLIYTNLYNETKMFVLNLFFKCAIDGKSVQYIVNAAR